MTFVAMVANSSEKGCAATMLWSRESMVILRQRLRLLNNAGRQQLRDLFQKQVIQCFRRVSMTMVIVVPKLRSVRPHHSRDLPSPERRMIAASQDWKIFFQSEP